MSSSKDYVMTGKNCDDSIGESSQLDSIPSPLPEHKKLFTPQSGMLSSTGSSKGSAQSDKNSCTRNSGEINMVDVSYDLSLSIPIQSAKLVSHDADQEHSADPKTDMEQKNSLVLNSLELEKVESLTEEDRSNPQTLKESNSSTLNRNGETCDHPPLNNSCNHSTVQQRHDFILDAKPATTSISDKKVAASITGQSAGSTVSSRKRRLPSNESGRSHTVVDPKVVQATNNIISLLQLYGSLSYVQLKVNIAAQFDDDDTSSMGRLQQVLDVLVELGVIHIIDSEEKKMHSNDRTKSKPIDAISESRTPITNPVYSIGSRAPRMDVVFPSQILEKIREAGNEILRINQRIESLRAALLVDDSPVNDMHVTDNSALTRNNFESCSPKDSPQNVLHQLLEQHSEIVTDPTYAAALRIFKIDTTRYDGERLGKDENKKKSNNKRNTK